MARIKAIIVGVSYYFDKKVSDLPFCRNDISAMRKAFVQGLGVLPANIISYGESGVVMANDIKSTLRFASSNTAKDDILLFYFSGHGMNDGKDHCLVLSDVTISTQEVIKYLEAVPAKSKVIFLDCCHAGNFEVDGTAVFDVNAAVEDFAGKGYAVFASSRTLQLSYEHPDKQISLFTSFLCDALTDRYITREGKKSLYDIHKLLFLMIEIWNQGHPDVCQTPVFRANMGGTIFFKVEEYHPYVTRKCYYDSETYTIYSVKPIHIGITKRYSVEVVIKSPMSFSEIAVINREIIDRVKYLDIYSTQRQEILLKRRPANIVFCYFGMSETDLINNNYICHTTWTDETQDKKWWYKTGKNFQTINGISFNINPHYVFLRQFMMDHTASREELVSETKEIIHRLISLAEQIISIYNEFLNHEISESELIVEIRKLSPEISTLYFRESDLDIPPIEIAEWSQQCSAIAGCIHDFTLYYSDHAIQHRTQENRKACMNMTIKRYYEDLEKMKKLEKDI